jgi:hypothetical protein
MGIKPTSAYKTCEFINNTTEVVSLLHVSVTYCGHLQGDVFRRMYKAHSLCTVQHSQQTTPHYLDGDTNYKEHEHPSLTQFSTKNCIGIYIFTYTLTLILET